MGTKSLTAVKLNNDYKVAEYGQFDGYPEVNGVKILHFLKNTMDENAFKNKLNILKKAKTKNDIQSVNKQQKNIDGAKVLNYIQNKQVDLIIDSIEFAKDDLFCEWAYLIDFDKNTFEIYANNEIQDFDFLPNTRKEFENLNLIKTYNLNNLPTKKEFIESFN